MSWSTFWETDLLRSMFTLTIPVAEKVLRPIVVYLGLVILLRIFGKRELAQLNPFDLIVLLSLSNTVQNAIIGPDTSVTGGLIGATSLFGVNYLVVRFLFKHRRLDQLVEGTPTVLVEGGTVVTSGLARELLNRSELLSVVHRQGFAGLEEVEHCELEPGGTFTVVGKAPRHTDRRHDELMRGIDRLGRQLDDLQRRLDGRHEGPSPGR